MDVTPAAAEEIMRVRNVRQLIHGHTHRPAQHEFMLDWYDQGSVVRVMAQQQLLECLNPARA